MYFNFFERLKKGKRCEGVFVCLFYAVLLKSVLVCELVCIAISRVICRLYTVIIGTVLFLCINIKVMEGVRRIIRI